jgi:hypothetical protein
VIHGKHGTSDCGMLRYLRRHQVRASTVHIGTSADLTGSTCVREADHLHSTAE